MTIILSDFAKRQNAESRFSHFNGTTEDLISRVELSLLDSIPGYREGVLRVPLKDVDGFFSSTVTLKEGDQFTGTYAPRKPGEAPRKQIGVVGGQKMPAKRVEVILYHRDVLAEGGENTSQADGTHAEWEIVSINATPTLESEPMTVGTLLANHLHEAGSNDGGTSTGMTDEDLVKALRTSYLYWRDKAMIA